MQSKIYAYLTTAIGVLIALPLLGLEAIGTLSSGILGWIVAACILAIGITGIINSHKN